MRKKVLISAGGVAILSVALIVLPGTSAQTQKQNEKQREITKIRVQKPDCTERVDIEGPMELTAAEAIGDIDQEPGSMAVLVGDEGHSWLGVETHEVSTEDVKEWKLPAERGVVVERVTPDSPAGKAGLKEKDVITEINGQRVEGTAQFRRMVRETPPGRKVQLTVWRGGQTQTLSATLGKAEEGRRTFSTATPGAFAFRLPEVEALGDLPQLDMDSDMVTGMFAGARPRLGIDAEDIGGQLGAYFGAPDGEGVLVRGVNEGSPAEKAGVKAGDVITQFNGEPIRSLGDLRERLAGTKEEDRSVKLGILRNKNTLSLTVELPAPEKKIQRRMEQRTHI